jgi:hypothetical protein
MPGQGETQRGRLRYQPGNSIDAMLYNGLDPTAAWRLHMREQTMARQAAERRFAKRTQAVEHDGPARDREGVQRSAAFRAELARISAEHWAWLREHGAEMADRPQRKQKLPVTAQQ